MNLGHEAQHLKKAFALWRMNMKMSKNLRQNDEVYKIDNFTFKNASPKYLHKIEALHLQLFRQPFFNWLRFIYRFRVQELGSIIVDEKDRVIAYDLFMFNESEYKDNILHELYVGVAPSYQGQGLATRLRKFSVDKYNYGRLNALSTVAAEYDIKALRSAQKAGFSIAKKSLKPPAHYLVLPLIKRHE